MRPPRSRPHRDRTMTEAEVGDVLGRPDSHELIDGLVRAAVASGETVADVFDLLAVLYESDVQYSAGIDDDTLLELLDALTGNHEVEAANYRDGDPHSGPIASQKERRAGFGADGCSVPIIVDSAST